MQSNITVCFMFVLVALVATYNWGSCYHHCRCTDDHTIVACTSQHLSTVPQFPATHAVKIATLGLQRNRLRQIDGALVGRSFPNLRTLDLRDQLDVTCVVLISPLPTSVKVLGKFFNHLFTQPIYKSYIIAEKISIFTSNVHFCHFLPLMTILFLS